MSDIKAAAIAAVCFFAAVPGQAAFLTNGEFRSSLGAPNSQLVDMPAQSITITDAYGTYTPATRLDPVFTGGPQYVGLPYPVTNPTDYFARLGPTPASTEAGQLAGNFGCDSFFYRCLGAYRITYTLPFEIVGLAGLLDLRVGPGQLSDIRFFEFPTNSLGPDGNPYRYTGFWADTFAATNTITIDWLPGDLNASFVLSNAQVIRATRVPEPGTVALLGTAMLGLLWARRKAT